MPFARGLSPRSTAAEYFAGMIESYDSLIRRAVPRYEEMTARLMDFLPASARDVLELGCGTGNLSLALTDRYPQARFTFVDASGDMLELTKTRISERSRAVADSARWLERRFEELGADGEEHDLIVSAISVHHVADKAALFRELRFALKPGGRLVFSDQMRAAPASAHRHNWDEWLAFCRAPGNCSEEEIESLLAHAEAHDHYETVERHIAQLTRAGFGEIDCLWRSGMWAIVTATA